MSASRRLRIVLALSLLVVTCLAATACSPAKRTAEKLHGVWYEDQTGQTYDFISDTQLVLPTTLSNGSNAVNYSVIGSDRISLQQADVVHVISITKLDKNELDTNDPVAASTNKYFRNLEETTWAKNRQAIANGALPALKAFPTITPKPNIVWLSNEPTDSADMWTKWPTSSMARYAKAWTWGDIARNSTASLVTSGTTGSQAFAVDFNRTIPTQQQLDAYQSSTGEKVTAGLAHIAVGYSSDFANYPAGTFIYINSRLLYSLGSGYAISVDVGPTAADGFQPGTHS